MIKMLKAYSRANTIKLENMYLSHSDPLRVSRKRNMRTLAIVL